MGNCMSSGSNGVEVAGEQKKKSQMIDRALEEDSKRLRRECKILLLGKPAHESTRQRALCHTDDMHNRLRRERQVDDCQADEDHTPERIQCR